MLNSLIRVGSRSYISLLTPYHILPMAIDACVTTC
ncbi:hypothetical protein Phi14:2_gp008 [Cellulophaga phage phi14:2]|uniref:Uncharacterized protein n=1 Tax=Cellulophaga phage phi14:2 TaxID=1327990 RepID=S0A0I1_9CAUD|nr:hypothetical protein Phi14:2_gp008 [Cellulophaga phage phi14:2]